jgi:hypothetical protein
VGSATASSRARHYAIRISLLTRSMLRSRLTPAAGPPSPRLRRAAFACIHERRLVGLSRFELLTPRLSSVCSNQLSYRPQGDLLKPLSKNPGRRQAAVDGLSPAPEGDGGILSKLDRTCAHPREYQIDHFKCLRPTPR